LGRRPRENDQKLAYVRSTSRSTIAHVKIDETMAGVIFSHGEENL
jgi:hypothetical protein